MLLLTTMYASVQAESYVQSNTATHKHDTLRLQVGGHEIEYGRLSAPGQEKKSEAFVVMLLLDITTVRVTENVSK